MYTDVFPAGFIKKTNTVKHEFNSTCANAVFVVVCFLQVMFHRLSVKYEMINPGLNFGEKIIIEFTPK